MNITVEKQPNCNASLLVEVPSDTVQSERNKIVKTYTSQARIQGFRPGKAPRKVIEKRFGSSITSELEERLARQAFEKAMTEQGLKVLDFGRPADFKETPDGSVTFRSQLTLAPEINLPDYKGITITAGSAEVTEEEVEQNLQSLRERLADYSDIEGRTATTGDLAVIDYTSTLDGTPLEEALGKPVGYLSGREGFWIKIDEESFLPGFAAELDGCAAGDEKEIKVTVPEDFPVAELHGKELVFDVKVKEIKEVSLPELDDEFAAKVTGGKGLDELKTMVEQQLGVEKQRQVDDAKVNQIVEHFNELVDFELPEELVREETQSQADSLVQRGVQSGMSEDEIAAQQAEIFATAGMQARTNLKTNFILQEIARVENIQISDAELVNHLATVAQSRKESPKKMIKQLQKEGRIPGIRNSMLVGKAIDFVLEHANVEEASASTEDQEEKS
ncbi:trigger factor [Haloferula rosea]|uniref:Trigger factor n=1 Tax=Haloferula rosea TaxID=490093 RepID=A0A934VGM7_9BACT|nr:trigger factor [Haloferula rosea]MBK1827735.1 trigger factor [Haloferula rosea]